MSAPQSVLHSSETWTMKVKDKSRFTAAETKFFRRAAKCTWRG